MEISANTQLPKQVDQISLVPPSGVTIPNDAMNNEIVLPSSVTTTPAVGVRPKTSRSSQGSKSVKPHSYWKHHSLSSVVY